MGEAYQPFAQPQKRIVTLAFNCKLILLGNRPNFFGAAVFMWLILNIYVPSYLNLEDRGGSHLMWSLLFDLFDMSGFWNGG